MADLGEHPGQHPGEGEAESSARVYEAGLADDPGRRARGAFYTPPELVDWILDHALTPRPGRVLDPACGTGHFLVAAARRLGDARAVWGSDTDPAAVEIARRRLAELDPTLSRDELAARVRVADGLTAWEGERFDAVVGNPPFLGQLRRRSAGQTGGLGAYTDTSAAFLHRSLGLLGDAGVVAMVQPLSILAARDAGPVRELAAQRGALVDLWCSPRPVFADTPVLTCVPVIRVGGRPATDPDAWGAWAAPAFGIPAVELPTGGGTVADLATCTADFRDQYYGLAPFVGEAGSVPGRSASLITSGLIDPAESRWGRTPTRFNRTAYDAPSVDLDALAAGPDRALARWAEQRRVPKLLVAAQGRVIEAVVDEDGTWLPSVPVLTVVPRPGAPADTLWRLLAVTLAPPVVAAAAARYLGAGLSPGSVKVSARQFAALALPGPDAGAQDAWEQGARWARAAHRAGVDGDRGGLSAALREAGAAMARAYGLAPEVAGRDAYEWWTRRLERADDLGGGGTVSARV